LTGRRALGVLALVGVTLVTAIVAAAAVALGTVAGRDVVVRGGIAYANTVLDGILTVDSISGGIYRGLDLRGVSLVGTDGTPFLAIPHLQLRYRVRDLLSGRIVLGQVTLDSPTVTLVQGPDGRFNYQRILKLGGPSGGGTSPLIAFNDAAVRAARVTLETRSVEGQDTTILARHIAIAHAELPYVRLSSPLPGQNAVRLDVRTLVATVSEPALDIRDLAGRIQVLGDTVMLALSRLALPSTVTTVRGSLWGLGEGPYLNLTLDAEHLDTRDVRPLVRWLPAGLTGSGRFDVALGPDSAVHFRARALDMRAAEGGGVRGTLTYSARAGGHFTLGKLDVTMNTFPVHYLRAIFDTMPVAGRLTGRTQLDGPNDSITANMDWEFADARVPGAPITDLVGDGVLSVHRGGGFAFGGFAVRRARVALATVHELVPAVALQGELDAVGTLDGGWRDVQFSGSARHLDGTLPPSVARGVVRLDTRGDTVGVWADLLLDSLAVAGVQPSYPGLRLTGDFAGDVHLAGYADSIAARIDLSGPDGALAGTGTLTVLPERIGARDLDLTFRDLVPDSTLAPATRVTGAARGRVAVDSAGSLRAALRVRLATSVLSGVAVDSAVVDFRADRTRVVADTLHLWAPGIEMEGRGGLALHAPARDSLTVQVSVDSIARVLPLLARMTPQMASATSDTIDGTMTGRAVLRGAMDQLDVEGTAVGHGVRWNTVRAPQIEATLAWGTGQRTVGVDLTLDTLSVGTLGFAAIEAHAHGRAEALAWQLRARLGEDGSFISGGTYAADSARQVVRVDSLGVLLGTDAWFLDRGATVTVDDSAVVFHGFGLALPSGASRVSLDGSIPRTGPGHFTGRIEGLALADLWMLAQSDPSTVSGTISGTFDLGGTARAPTIDASLAMRDGVFGDFHAPYLEGHFAYAEQRVGGTVGLWRTGQQILKVDVSLPIDLALRDAHVRELPGPISVRATAQGVDLSIADAINTQIRQAGGRLSADLGITGTWARPELTGSLSVTDGATTLPALGVRHRNLNGEIVLSGDTITIRRLTLTSGNGTADVSGYVRLEQLTTPILHLDIKTHEFRAIDVRNFLALTGTGELQLRGPLYAATLTGTDTVTQGVLYFADIVQKDVINLEDTLYAGIVDTALLRRQGLGTQFQSRFLDSLRVDSLKLTMGNDVWLRSDEANIQLVGPVTVGKIGDHYRIDGTLTTPRGTYRLPLGPTISKDFTVTRGQVRYFGTPDLNAALDIDAKHTLRTQRGETIGVLVHVGGTINAPTLTLSSDIRPPISETEIISYLLFGAPSVQAAGGGVFGNTAAQMVSTAASKITGQLGSSLISDLGVPLDFFEVRPEIGSRGYEGTEISLGRQLGDRWFLTLSPRLCTQQQWTYQNLGASVEFRMSQHWRLSASADPLQCAPLGGQGTNVGYQLGFDILWEKRY